MKNQDKEKVAFVNGANGVTGEYLVAQLATEPGWTQIIATSRKPPNNLPSDPRVRFEQADLNVDAESIKRILTKWGLVGTMTHFFHMAYIHHDRFEKQYEYNVPFFRNVLTAVEALNRESLERVLLQTGAKHYGVAKQAPPPGPIVEELGRIETDLPNFYFPQEDFMFDLQRGKKWSWTVTRPFLVNGFTSGSGQSFMCTAAIYFTIQKYLGEDAIFAAPATGHNAYTDRYDISSAAVIAAFNSHVASNPGAANQAYNIVDSDITTPSWKDLWEYMGAYFDVPVKVVPGFDIQKDIQNKIDRGVWKEIVERYGGHEDACEKYATWFFFSRCMSNTRWEANVSMDKAARETGWITHADSREEIGKVFDAMKQKGAIPKNMSTFSSRM